MTAETGIMHETLKYSMNHKLPIHFIIEDNNLSVCTNTRKVWNSKKLLFEVKKTSLSLDINIKINIHILVQEL